jgi:hypothetical protein
LKAAHSVGYLAVQWAACSVEELVVLLAAMMVVEWVVRKAGR